ncbi:MAG: MFS transporter, partial [Micrococcales bacterium]
SLLIVLALGMGIRAWFDFTVMIVLSLLAALSIAMLNVILPTVIRSEFKDNIPKMTGLYTTTASTFASISAFVTVPLVQAFGSFQASLTFWVIPSILAIACWLLLQRIEKEKLEQVHAEVAHPNSAVFRSPMTWAITGLFGIQSANFYAILNWFPSLLESEGYSRLAAGAWLSVVTVIGIPVGLFVSQNLSRFKNLSRFAVLISLFTALGFALMLAGGWVQLAGALCTGIGLGTTFPLSLALIGVKGTTKAQTTLLSAVTQGAGYLIAAAGAFTMGMLYDLTGSWGASLITLTVTAIVQAVCAGYAASKRPL